jgi:hypothetical protein
MVPAFRTRQKLYHTIQEVCPNGFVRRGKSVRRGAIQIMVIIVTACTEAFPDRDHSLR